MSYVQPRWSIEITMAPDCIHAEIRVLGRVVDQAQLDEIVTALTAMRPLLASDPNPSGGPS